MILVPEGIGGLPACMNDLDRLHWAASVSVRAFGVKFGVRVNDAGVLKTFLDRLPPGSRVYEPSRPDVGRRVYSIIRGEEIPRPLPGRHWQVYADSDLEVQAFDHLETLNAFEGLVRFDVARLAERWTFVHAGAVGWNGRGILVPGLSRAGKSRLVEALVRAGATYYSDEYAVLDRRGRLFPFAKPITLRREDGSLDRVSASELGGEVGTEPIPVGMVVATSHAQEARWRPTQVAGGGTVLALLVHTVRAQLAPARVLKTLSVLAQGATTFEGVRGEADDVAKDLLRRASSEEPRGLRESA